MPYRKLRVVEATEVPGWERRPPKWQEIAQEVMNLEVGKTAVYAFDDINEAERARNAVRDAVNLEARSVVVRTRVVETKNDGATLYLTKVGATPSQK